MYQEVLPKITSDHFPILLRMGTKHAAKRPFKLEDIWLEVGGFCDLVKVVWNDFNVSGSSSFILVKKSMLKEWNREVFGHLDTKLGALFDKVKVLDA